MAGLGGHEATLRARTSRSIAAAARRAHPNGSPRLASTTPREKLSRARWDARCALQDSDLLPPTPRGPPQAQPRPRPHARPRQLAQPGRGLLLDPPAQGAHAQRLLLDRKPRRPHPARPAHYDRMVGPSDSRLPCSHARIVSGLTWSAASNTGCESSIRPPMTFPRPDITPHPSPASIRASSRSTFSSAGEARPRSPPSTPATRGPTFSRRVGRPARAPYEWQGDH
jgi:hypothetical protein